MQAELFSRKSLHDLLTERLETIAKEIKAENEDTILTVDLTQYADSFVERFSLDPPVVTNPELTHGVERIRGAAHPRDFDVSPERLYERQTVTYMYRVEGMIELLQYHPLRYTPVHMDPNSGLDFGKREVFLTVVNFGDMGAVERQWQSFDQRLREEVARLLEGVKTFNNQLAGFVRNKVNERREDILKRRKAVESLSVPLRKEPPPPSLRIPLEPRKIPNKPTGAPGRLHAEPALNEEQYGAVLLALHKLGRALETLPSTYLGKKEEQLRDLLLMHLRLYFDTVSGESINKKGKTDILISHEGGNAFVAECKFWEGPKGLLDAIDQLLGYLTWRDSKAAIVLFVRGQLQPVLDSIPTHVRAHSNFVSDRGRVGEGWYRFELHIEDDATRTVHLAVLCYHLKPLAKGKKD